MPEFFPEIDINESQAEAIARGLYAVAKADGTVHEKEAAIIMQFYHSTTEHPADLTGLDRQPAIDGASLALQLPRADLRRLFLKTAVLLSYADGTYGAAESKVISGFAKAFEVGDKDLSLIETQVKEFLLSQLAHLSNTAATAQVARDLKI
jgi:tellurite resistance protein